MNLEKGRTHLIWGKITGNVKLWTDMKEIGHRGYREKQY